MSIEKLIEKVINEENSLQDSEIDKVLKIFKSVKLPPGYKLDIFMYEEELSAISINNGKLSKLATYNGYHGQKVSLLINGVVRGRSEIKYKEIPIDANTKSKIEKFIFGVYELSKIDTSEMLKKLFASIKS